VPGHVLGECRTISPADIESFVAVEEIAPIPDSNQTGIALSVDNEHASCSNDEVVNVASGARHASVMKDGNSIDGAQNVTELSLAN